MRKKTIAIIMLLFFHLNAYAEGAGIRINYKDFHIRVEYNDNVYDKMTGVDYIRKPSGLLFDLISLMQNNKSTLAKLDLDILVLVGNDGNFLYISQSKPVYKKHLLLKGLKQLDKNILLNSICKIISIKKCIPQSDKNQTWFYISDSNVSSDTADLIEFGCFPCNNIINYTLTTRFQSSNPNVPTPKFKKVTVDRQTIYHYFNKLLE